MATQEPRPEHMPQPGVPYGQASADAKLISQTIVTASNDICARLDRMLLMQSLTDLLHHGFAAVQSRFDQLFIRVDSLTTAVGITSQELSEVQSKLDQVFARLDALKALEERVMAVGQDVLALMKNMDAATTRLGVDVAALVASVKNSMTDEEVANIKAAGLAIQANLEAIAASAENPTPPPTPQLAQARKKLGT